MNEFESFDKVLTARGFMSLGASAGNPCYRYADEHVECFVRAMDGGVRKGEFLVSIHVFEKKRTHSDAVLNVELAVERQGSGIYAVDDAHFFGKLLDAIYWTGKTTGPWQAPEPSSFYSNDPHSANYKPFTNK